MNNMYSRAFFFCVLGLSLTACVSLPGGGLKQEESLLPHWVLNPPADDSQTYYGIGQAWDLSHAKKVALQEISSKISVSVGGASETTSTLHNDLFQESAFVRINTKTQDKELQNYSVEQVVQNSGQFYALISIAEADLVNSWRLKLERLDRLIEADVAGLSPLSALEQYVAWGSIIPKVGDAVSYLSLITTVNPGFQVSSYEQRYLGYQKSARDASNNLNVYVNSETNFIPVSKKIIKHLTQSGIKVSESKTKQTNAIVEIKGTERKQIVFESYTVELRMTIAILNSSGKIIVTTPINVSGGSVIDYASARISAANKLNNKIEKNGVFSVLGLTQ